MFLLERLFGHHNIVTLREHCFHVLRLICSIMDFLSSILLHDLKNKSDLLVIDPLPTLDFHLSIMTSLSNKYSF